MPAAESFVAQSGDALYFGCVGDVNNADTVLVGRKTDLVADVTHIGTIVYIALDASSC